MGQQIQCTVRFGKQVSQGKALLETNELVFRGKFRLVIPFKQPDGAIWVVRPKGRQEITEQDTMAAGKAAGLVDVKVVGFSETHTAEKFVVPLARRRAFVPG